ncbi:MAG: GDP-fucose synthetase [Syntrophobacterales bacterium CG_4_8_14_3_um_filter_49_14]|nr:MAG: GDP-fucose synthetase [Syntrophobacterales bacterium CG23_combo_of_CG06-09_8_20_14_all_48_27]PJC73057.1 MAG: GDP-fucose synthetase [Syntrophobacterales bacterium CG_4_8_14_3_um_filter_49_14]
MEQNKKIYVAGHQGLVGSAIVGKLRAFGCTNIIMRASKDLDLRSPADVSYFFEKERPDYVFLAAAKVGGILANSAYPAEFIYDNLMIQTNVINNSYVFGVKKLLFLGSSCIYPKFAPQPIKEEYLLDGKLEPTNEPYAIAKIAGIKMCQSYNRQYGTNFISAMPTNLYGPNDNFNLETSHVLPALLRKFHEAKLNKEPFVEIWGTGNPRREFLYIEDLADACVFLMKNYNEDEVINVGVGKDISIKELSLLIREVVGYSGELKFNTSKHDGTPRKLLDVSKLTKLGWEAKTSLELGIRKTYQWYTESAH